jgi:hypothetical protein
MSVQPTEYLTKGYTDEFERQIASSVPGMAYFAASGPFGAQCKDCAFYGYHRVIRNKAGDAVRTMFQRNRCAKFHELTGQHGDPVPPATESCRYFERRP